MEVQSALALWVWGCNIFSGVYNSSLTPSHLPWNTYNYCNAPHVNAERYSRPTDPDAHLVYLNSMMRHHKRTPDNLYPNERELNPASGWDWECGSQAYLDYVDGTAPVFPQSSVPDGHPFASAVWNGSCGAGQLTREGLEDAVQHGKDFWSVYHSTLGFLDEVVEEDIYIRTSNEPRTHHVAGGFLYGTDPGTWAARWRLHTQPALIDSLVPSYSCPVANAIRSAYQLAPEWTEHLLRNQDLQTRLGETLGVKGLQAWMSWYDHFFDTLTSRTCHGHPLPCNASGACVLEEDAMRVFALGDWEYNYIWNAAENASEYTRLTFGVMFKELADNLKRFQAGKETYKLRLYIGHDGSMIRLASGLGLGANTPLRWPAMGSEVHIEVWRDVSGFDFVRVMHDGIPVQSLDWIPFSRFVELLEEQVPADIYGSCMYGGI
ncbi:phosphoglycerate mutase-like protein [Coniophora puteana RWD-64-598 SS2]|uniref:Phosphoglycerate mutase-like protein n=1 Tax=Coniophora puteana (strain RWD-64-598) TaxID=741705 RepID=A0A5M3MR20_CONPW|nr:phosphoglycerate mutase-like protein [Coniophora puteana RWD-64-598 SS2]EIW81638.1 phosphoglycerate mutase-like protein [Coniophora puteana RWD-64-598 SS2]